MTSLHRLVLGTILTQGPVAHHAGAALLLLIVTTLLHLTIPFKH